MTSIQQRAELQRRIWQIANDVRGAVDGWDFKQYVVGPAKPSDTFSGKDYGHFSTQ